MLVFPLLGNLDREVPGTVFGPLADLPEGGSFKLSARPWILGCLGMTGKDAPPIVFAVATDLMISGYGSIVRSGSFVVPLSIARTGRSSHEIEPGASDGSSGLATGIGTTRRKAAL